MVVQKADHADKFEYRRSTRDGLAPVYPLYGWVNVPSVNGKKRCVVEDLRGDWSAPNPIYEVLAPKGYHFELEGIHSLLCHTLADLKGRLRGEKLVRCTPECGQ